MIFVRDRKAIPLDAKVLERAYAKDREFGKEKASLAGRKRPDAADSVPGRKGNRMLGIGCIEAYAKQYPSDRCGINEEDERMIIEAASGARAVEEPAGETGESFMDRLERSKKERCNLFFREWPRCLTIEERLEDSPARGLSEVCIEAYRRQYPEDDIRPAPRGRLASILWTDERCPGGYFISVQPEEETNTAFIDRLHRSRMAGRNLFHEEWMLDR